MAEPSAPTVPHAILRALPFFRSFRPDELGEFVAPFANMNSSRASSSTRRASRRAAA